MIWPPDIMNMVNNQWWKILKIFFWRIVAVYKTVYISTTYFKWPWNLFLYSQLFPLRITQSSYHFELEFSHSDSFINDLFFYQLQLKYLLFINESLLSNLFKLDPIINAFFSLFFLLVFSLYWTGEWTEHYYQRDLILPNHLPKFCKWLEVGGHASYHWFFWKIVN